MGREKTGLIENQAAVGETARAVGSGENRARDG